MMQGGAAGNGTAMGSGSAATQFPAAESLATWSDRDALLAIAAAVSAVGKQSSSGNGQVGNGTGSNAAAGSTGFGTGFRTARQVAVENANGGSPTADAQAFLFACQAQKWMWRVAPAGLHEYFSLQGGSRPPESEQLAFYLAGALDFRMRQHAGDLLAISDDGDEQLSADGVTMVRTVADMALGGWRGGKVVVRKLILGLVSLLHHPALPSQPPPLQLLLQLFLAAPSGTDFLPFDSLPDDRKTLLLEVLRLVGEQLQGDFVPARKKPVPEQLSQVVGIIVSALNHPNLRMEALDALAAFLGSRSLVVDEEDGSRGFLPNADLASLLPQLLSLLATPDSDSSLEQRTAELIGQVLGKMRGDAAFSLLLGLLPNLVPRLQVSLADTSSVPHSMDVFFGLLSKYPEKTVEAFARGHGTGDQQAGAVAWILEAACGLLARVVEEGVTEEDEDEDASTMPLIMLTDLFDHLATLPTTDPAMTAFAPVAQSVVAAILQRAACPAGWRKWHSDKKRHHLNALRPQLAELVQQLPTPYLLSIAVPAALDSMKSGYTSLAQGTEAGWHALEVGCWLVEACAEGLPGSAPEAKNRAREAAAIVTPVANSMIDSFRNTNRLAQEPFRVLHTCLSMYSALADKEGLLDPDQVGSWIGTVVGCLGIPSLAAKAAVSFKMICSSSLARGLVAGLPELVGAIQQAGLVGRDLGAAVEGIAAVIVKAPKPQAAPVVRTVLELLLSRVANGVAIREQGLEMLVEAMQQLNGFLRGLGMNEGGGAEDDVVDLTGEEEVPLVVESSRKVVRHEASAEQANEEEMKLAVRDIDTSVLIEGTWRVLDQIADIIRGWRKLARDQEEVIEGFCALWLTLLRLPSTALPLALTHRARISQLFADLIGDFPAIAKLYDVAAAWTTHRPSQTFLAASEPRDTSQLVCSATSSATRVLTAEGGIQNHPDTTHTFFSLLSRCLSDPISQAAFAGMPSELLDPLFLRLVPMAMGGDDKMATRSVSQFLSEFVGRGRSEEGAGASEQALGKFVDAVVARLGEAIVSELLGLISNRAPRSLVAQLTDLLHAFWAKYPTETRAVVTNWLTAYESGRVNDSDKRILLKKLGDNARHGKKFRDAVKEWSTKCRGLAGTAFGEL